jgi:hypothetical protein
VIEVPGVLTTQADPDKAHAPEIVTVPVMFVIAPDPPTETQDHA